MLEAVPAAVDAVDGLLPVLAALLADIGKGSAFNLVTALRAAQEDGVAGELVIHIPKKTRDHVQIEWHGRAGD